MEGFNNLEIETNTADGTKPWVEQFEMPLPRAARFTSKDLGRCYTASDYFGSEGGEDVEIDGEGVEVLYLKGYNLEFVLYREENISRY